MTRTPSRFYTVSVMLAAMLATSLWMGMGVVEAQDLEPYMYKARNLQPADFGIEGRNWDVVLRNMNDRMAGFPGDSALLLERAIAYREYGVRRSLLLRRRDWKRSRQDFEALLERDSSYNDVLYQYAMLERYDGDFDRAFALLRRQRALKPEMPHAAVALMRLYQQYLHEADSADADTWISAQRQDVAMYLQAERARKAGQLREADSLLSRLFKTQRKIPTPSIFLARARVYYAMNEPAIAQPFVMQTISAINDQTDAMLVLEDFKHILDDGEVARFLEIREPAAYRSFFQAMLQKRNPARSQRVDRRLTQHYHRLLEAEEKYAFYASREAYRVLNNVNRDRMADGDYPAAYWLNGEFGDKGLVFLRHGEPFDRVGSVTVDTPFIESWRYRAPAMDFHFEGHGSLAELIPTLPVNVEVLEAREVWGGIYTRLASAARVKRDGRSFGQRRQNEMDLLTYGNELFDESLKDVHAGLTSDRHRWSSGTRPLTIPHFMAAFKEDEASVDERAGQPTEVEVYFSVPIGHVSQLLAGRDRLGIEVGLSVHDMDWNEVYSSLETLHVAARRAEDALAVDFIRFQAPPDSYHVNLHVQITDTEWIGSYQFDYRVPGYGPVNGRRQLLMSDLLPALDISPADRPGRYTKNGLYLRTNPGRGYRKSDPFFIYFEIYNLTFGEDDLTQFEVTYILQEPEGQRRRGLFKRRTSEPLLSLTYEREGERLNEIEHVEIDMSSVPAGRYELVVVVTDKNTDMQVRKARLIALQ